MCSVAYAAERKREASLWVTSLFLFFWLSVLSHDIAAKCNDDLSSGYHSVGVLKSIYDGDTLTLKDGRKIRLIGINTPEMGRKQRLAEPLALEAKLFLQSVLMLGEPVQLRIGQQRIDHYGRILAHVFTEKGENVTAKLLRKGYGYQVLIAPNAWGESCYLQAEQLARAERAGVWGHPYYAVRGANSVSLRAGFALISGEVEGFFLAKNAVWIDLVGKIVLRIPKDNWQQFQSIRRQLIPGQEIEARGWLIDRKKTGKTLKKHRKRWMIKINHPGSLIL
ncbi:MAG: thermonuclease family protein [Pseudomonadales bacterium]|nr:thermonuclease family protein [Pseudomonadales bacterium]